MFYSGRKDGAWLMHPSRRVLNQQADRVEAVLASMSLPSRIQGGEVKGGWVRYHFAPLSEVQVGKIRQAAGQVAEAMGVYQVRVAEAPCGLALDIPMDAETPIALLPLLEELPNLPPLVAVMGLSSEGTPLMLNLDQPGTWHFFVTGPAGSGKSELLRTVMLSLALHSRQGHVQFLGIDLSGRELTVLEGLPHALTEVAHSPQFGLELLSWLDAEIQRRRRFHIESPHIALFMDGVDGFGRTMRPLRAHLRRICGLGQHVGVHLLLASPRPVEGWLDDLWCREGTAIARAPEMHDAQRQPPGLFEVDLDQRKGLLHAAWLPALELQQVVARINERRSQFAVAV